MKVIWSYEDIRAGRIYYRHGNKTPFAIAELEGEGMKERRFMSVDLSTMHATLFKSRDAFAAELNELVCIPYELTVPVNYTFVSNTPAA